MVQAETASATRVHAIRSDHALRILGDDSGRNRSMRAGSAGAWILGELLGQAKLTPRYPRGARCVCGNTAV